MAIFRNRSYIPTKPPIFNSDGRNEDFLIDVLGTWIPECELIIYGLLNDPSYSSALYKLRNMIQIKPKNLYLDYCYFNWKDLLRYLASDTDDLEDLDEELIEKLWEGALNHYLYRPCSETGLRHSIIELMNQPFLKSITLAYPWVPRDIDREYLMKIIPYSMLNKLNIAGGTIPNIIRDSGRTFTTIITNSLEDLEMMVDHREEYRVESTLFLLRNHSGNMSYSVDDDGEVNFVETGMETLLPKLIDMDTGIPLGSIRFGRFEPELYTDIIQRMSPH